jgi:hypothetical protein
MQCAYSDENHTTPPPRKQERGEGSKAVEGAVCSVQCAVATTPVEVGRSEQK